MNLIEPVEITDTILVATNVPENDHPEWLASTAFNLSDRAILSAQHSIYESLLDDANTGFPPDDILEQPPKWFRVSATNRWKAFDAVLKHQVEMPDLITYTFNSPDLINTIGFDGLDADEVNVKVYDINGQNVVFDQTVSTVRIRPQTGMWHWLFSRAQYARSVIVEGLPPLRNVNIVIEVRAPNRTARLGQLKLGRRIGISLDLVDTGVEGVNWSRRERDVFGNLEATDRMRARQVQYKSILPKQEVRAAVDLLTKLMTEPTFYYVGSDTEGLGTDLFGHCDVPKVSHGSTMSTLSLTVVGVGSF